MKPQAKFRLSLQLFSDSKLAPSIRALTTATPLTILSEHVLKHAKVKSISTATKNAIMREIAEDTLSFVCWFAAVS
jgi:hypothetical protein